MSFDVKHYFQNQYNKKRIHIEQLLILQQQKADDAAVKQRLAAQIERERQQLTLLDEVWDVQ